MKNLFLYFFLTLNFISFSQKNSGYAIYELIINNHTINKQFDSVNDTSITALNKYAKIMKKSVDNINDVNYKLIFTKNSSFYEIIEEMESENELSNMVKNIFTEKKKKFFYNFKNKTLIKQTEFEDQIYLIKSKSDSLKWKFTKETKNISDYTCYKATTIKRKKYPSGYKNIIVTAWYTNSIPIQSGPNKYVGLPGLIIELNEGARTFILKKINYTEKVKIKSLKGKEITEKEFKKIWMAGLSNFR